MNVYIVNRYGRLRGFLFISEIASVFAAPEDAINFILGYFDYLIEGDEYGQPTDSQKEYYNKGKEWWTKRELTNMNNGSAIFGYDFEIKCLHLQTKEDLNDKSTLG